MRFILRLIFWCLFKTKVLGIEKLDFRGPTLIMPNHVSFLDPILLYAYLPKDVYFVVNTTIAKRFRMVLRWFNHLTVDPLNPYSLKKAVSLVNSGKPMVIFPEGRITTTGNLMKLYSGIGLIALKTDATIYPVILLGPELSKFSRIRDKVRSVIFPEIYIHIFSPMKLACVTNQSFSQQKSSIGNKLLEVMQNKMFDALQQRERCTNLFDKLVEASKIHGSNKTIIEDIYGSISYKSSIIASYILGQTFRKLLCKEEIAGILLPNSIGHFVALFALFYSGKTPAILNFTAGISNNLDCAEAAGAKSIITSRTFIEKGRLYNFIKQLESKHRIIYLEDIKTGITRVDKLKGMVKMFIGQQSLGCGASKLILFTSGSESKPKGVVLKHTSILSNINQVSSIIDFTHRDKMLNALPMFHSFGLTVGTLLPVLRGFEVFMYPTPLHYKVIPEIAYNRNCTLLLGTPTFLGGYAKHAHPFDFYKIRYVIAGGEKLKEDVKEMWMNKFGVRIFEGYGTTEASPVLSVNTPLFNRKGSVGKFLPGIQYYLKPIEGIEDGGNLLVKGPNIMDGYLIDGKGFVPVAEWYDCGDVVTLDEDNFITIKSRIKRFAKISGEMVSLDAVENIAAQCFGTDCNAAISVQDAKKGEKIILFSTSKDASKQVFRDYLIKTGKSLLSMPSDIIIIDKLPLLGNGKTDYVSLRQLSMDKV